MPIETHHDKVVISLTPPALATPTTTGAVPAACTIYLHGATVTSWTVNGREMLFLSSKAILDGSKPIRGGIPLVFPQFGTYPGAPLPQHGFARTTTWRILRTDISPDETKATAVFVLTSADLSHAALTAWPTPFRLEYTVTVDAVRHTLSTDLAATNLATAGEFDMTFTWLLHTYLRVDAIEDTEIRGLEGRLYVNKAITDRDPATQAFLALPITEETDRVYQNVVPAAESHLHVMSGGRPAVEIVRTHGETAFRDVVVWNPWVDKAKAMADFGDDEYRHMVCVEVGDVAMPNAVSVAPGETRRAGQVLRALL
ncbi:hypothetical protein AMAG_03410 [Allomyces macrogynus ATCC 38327]|uniref:Glucose-6-phosphate 1-epimerase n=1 Tax=Allomyces macrogynus (strain ATCC 38327) TaxID=578462 RepID=A0A0L0S9J8_ALLM3|nr:hypothetical protein AMAG_03410 [Allomyces macrogynus ATCC 38327]|eukprot:KNE59064.1 hypothetical protein AMAG_03410 [Allomyces macrogynus ATCC 38327]